MFFTADRDKGAIKKVGGGAHGLRGTIVLMLTLYPSSYKLHVTY